MDRLKKKSFLKETFSVFIIVLILAPALLFAQKNKKEIHQIGKEIKKFAKEKKSRAVDNSYEAISKNLSFTNITIDAGTGGPIEPGKTGGHAVVFSDVDNDNLPDLYITMRFYEPMFDLFFHNNGGNTFTNEGALRGIDDFDGGSHGACFADLDNDGDYDLINGTTDLTVDYSAVNNIYMNDGHGYFTEITELAGIPNRNWPTRAVLAFDMENDGDLDLFCVTNYLGSEDPIDEFNEIYRNDGNLKFTSIDSGALYTAPVGQGAIATDYDDDGDIDIIAANRTGPLNVLNNNGNGNFLLISPDSIGIEHQGRDGISMGDIDNDGELDMLLVGNPNGYLYFNNGNGTFSFSRKFSNTEGYMGGFADIDNDGDLDLIFAGDDRCYLNDGLGNFIDGPNIPVGDIEDPRAIGFADIDNDGDLDFAVGCKRSQNYLIQNNYNLGNWLRIKLFSKDGQAGAFGTKVYIYPAGQSRNEMLGMREARSTYGYLGQDDPVLHFGLGENHIVDVVAIFLDEIVVLRKNVVANQIIVIKAEDSDFSINNPDIPTGPSNGLIGQNLMFNVDEVISSNCNGIEYQFNWGDNTLSDWDENTQEHIYYTSGIFSIKVRARCQSDNNIIVSDWSDSVAVLVEGLALSISINPPEGGIVSRTPEKHEYAFQDTVELNGLANQDYEFEGWSGDIISNQSNLFIIMNHNKDIIANFKKIKETIQMSMIISSTDSAILGEKIYFEASGAISNLGHILEYQFDWGDSTFSEWGENKREKIFNFSDTFFVKVHARCQVDTNIVSQWSEIKQIIIIGYVLSILIEPTHAGIVEKNPDKYEYALNDTIRLSPISVSGYQFDFWENDLTGSDSPASVIMNENKNITAYFLEIAETISVPIKPVGPDSGHVRENLVFVTDSAATNLGHEVEYQFYWGDGILSEWGSNSGQHIYSYKDTMQIKARARCKIHPNVISDWSAIHVLSIIDYRFNLLVSVFPTEGGTINRIPDKEFYNLGDVIILTPIPSEYYEFDHWEGDMNGNDVPATIMMDSSKHIIAYFKEIKEIIIQPQISAGATKGFRKQELQFSTRGAKSNIGHELEYQFQWDDSSYSAWGDTSRLYSYSENGEYLIHVRARCKTHLDIISDWSESHKIQIVGCKLNITLNPDSSGIIFKEPNLVDYNYGEFVTLSVNAKQGYFFSHWNGDLNDTTITKIIILNKDTTVYAYFDRISNVLGEKKAGKLHYELYQNYPNPFNPETNIKYQIAENCKIKIAIHNVKGQRIKYLLEEFKSAGEHSIMWDGTNNQGNRMPSGIYFYSITSRKYNDKKKMILLR